MSALLAFVRGLFAIPAPPAFRSQLDMASSGEQMDEELPPLAREQPHRADLLLDEDTFCAEDTAQHRSTQLQEQQAAQETEHDLDDHYLAFPAPLLDVAWLIGCAVFSAGIAVIDTWTFLNVGALRVGVDPATVFSEPRSTQGMVFAWAFGLVLSGLLPAHVFLDSAYPSQGPQRWLLATASGPVLLGTCYLLAKVREEASGSVSLLEANAQNAGPDFEMLLLPILLSVTLSILLAAGIRQCRVLAGRIRGDISKTFNQRWVIRRRRSRVRQSERAIRSIRRRRHQIAQHFDAAHVLGQALAGDNPDLTQPERERRAEVRAQATRTALGLEVGQRARRFLFGGLMLGTAVLLLFLMAGCEPMPARSAGVVVVYDASSSAGLCNEQGCRTEDLVELYKGFSEATRLRQGSWFEVVLVGRDAHVASLYRSPASDFSTGGNLLEAKRLHVQEQSSRISELDIDSGQASSAVSYAISSAGRRLSESETTHSYLVVLSDLRDIRRGRWNLERRVPEPQEYIDLLQADGSFPDLKGAEVRVCGAHDRPEPGMHDWNPAMHKALTSSWNAVFKAAGASSWRLSEFCDFKSFFNDFNASTPHR